jgi:hypothetical protein
MGSKKFAKRIFKRPGVHLKTGNKESDVVILPVPESVVIIIDKIQQSSADCIIHHGETNPTGSIMM